MKKILFALVFVSGLAFAEASFDQIEQLIGRQQYAAAEQGLDGIIKNHPNSAKAYYAMAQAQAGLGNQQKAQFALDKARGLDPDLNFATPGSVQKLQDAITPQTKKIEVVEESHFWRNFFLLLLVAGLSYTIYHFFIRKSDDPETTTGGSGPKPSGPDDDYHKASPSDQAYMREHNMGPKTKVYASEAKTTTTRSSNPAPVYVAPPVTQPTVVNNHYGSNNDGLVTGMILGNMMSSHDRTVVVEKEIVREVPSKSYSSPADTSWTDSSIKSSSWDDTSSSSSSWDSDSSSSSSSSWDSSSDSSSSWDSGSSSSDSSW